MVIVIVFAAGMAVMAQTIFVFALIRAWDHVQQGKREVKEEAERNRKHDSLIMRKAALLGISVEDLNEQIRGEDLVGSN